MNYWNTIRQFALTVINLEIPHDKRDEFAFDTEGRVIYTKKFCESTTSNLIDYSIWLTSEEKIDEVLKETKALHIILASGISKIEKAKFAMQEDVFQEVIKMHPVYYMIYFSEAKRYAVAPDFYDSDSEDYTSSLYFANYQAARDFVIKLNSQYNKLSLPKPKIRIDGFNSLREKVSSIEK